jgi:hypothetical protein
LPWSSRGLGDVYKRQLVLNIKDLNLNLVEKVIFVEL